MIALFSPKRRGWLVLAVLVVAALAGGAVWVALDPPWSASSHTETLSTTLASTALTVNREQIGYENLAVAARRAETAALETGAASSTVSAAFSQGANGAFVRVVLLREAMVSLVRQAIVVQEARTRKIEIPDKKLEEETQDTLTQLAEQSQSSGSNISSVLLEVGENLDEFKADLREQTRIRLLSDEVALAVIGQIKPSDEELRALYESQKATYGDDYDAARDRVRSDYNRAEVSRRREQWLAEQLAKAEVKIADPMLAAFDQVKRGNVAGLAELERLWREKRVYDPYLPYYIARIYNDQAIAAFAERQDLEKRLTETPTIAQTASAQIETLRTRVTDATAKAITMYVATLMSAPADDDLLRRILQLNPSVAVRALVLGLTALSEGDLAQAESQLQESLRLDPDLAAARLALGDLAVKKGDAAKALTLYREAAARSPKDVDVLLAVGDACLSLEQPTEAEKQFRAARAVGPEYARLWIAEGDLALRRLYDAVAQRDRLSAQATQTGSKTAGQTALEKTIAELYEATRKAYDKALERGQSESILVKIGNAELLAGKLDEAMSVFRQVLRRTTHYPEAHIGLGDILAERGDQATALAHYTAALGRLTVASQQFGVLSRILNIDPTNGPVRVAYGIALTRLGRWNEAIVEFSRILEAQPDMIQVHLWIAESYSALGDYATAIAHLKTGLGTTATPAAKDSAGAQIIKTLRKQYESGSTPPSDSLDLLINVARNFIGSGYPSDAVEALGLLATIDPTYRHEEVVRLLEAARTAPTKSQGTID